MGGSFRQSATATILACPFFSGAPGIGTTTAQTPGGGGSVTEAGVVDGETFSVFLDAMNAPGGLELMRRPALLYGQRAHWPLEMAKRTIAGCVIYSFSIDPEGYVSNVHIADYSELTFVEHGLDALYTFRFEARPVDDVGDPAEPKFREGGSDSKPRDPWNFYSWEGPHLIKFVWYFIGRPLPIHSACERAYRLMPLPTPESEVLGREFPASPQDTPPTAAPLNVEPDAPSVEERRTEPLIISLNAESGNNIAEPVDPAAPFDCDAWGLVPAPITQGENRGPFPWFRVQPRFPDGALAQGLPGCATYGFTITEEGRTADVRVIESSSDLFNAVGLRAIEQFCYAPGLIDGAAAETPSQTIRLVWPLKGKALPDHPACNG